MAKSLQKTRPDPYEDEIDLGELVSVLWAGKWVIGGVAFLAAVIAIAVVLIMPNMYRAEALLAPNDQDGAGGLSALAAQYGGLASLAGLSLGSGSTDKTALGLEVLKSRKFISEFIERRDILVPLFATTSWAAETGELDIDPDIFDVESEEWVRQISFPRQTVPSGQEAYDSFMKILSVFQNNKTGFVTVSIEHHSPIVAKQWVDWLVHDLNSTIMRQDVTEAEQAIDYLHEQLERTSVAGLRKVFFNLIEEQTKTVMLARVADEYLLKTIDPAVAPEMKTGPRRSLIVVISAVISSFLAMALILVISSMQKKKLN